MVVNTQASVLLSTQPWVDYVEGDHSEDVCYHIAKFNLSHSNSMHYTSITWLDFCLQVTTATQR
jgi:hypothetical protein